MHKNGCFGFIRITPVTSGLKAGDEVVVQGVAAVKGAWLGLGAEDK